MDKRQHERLALEEKGWSGELIDQVTGEKLGEVVNLSPGGLMLAGVMVLWCSAASQVGCYWAGMQIIDIDTDSWDRLRALSVTLAGAA